MTEYPFDPAVASKGAIVRLEEDAVARLDASGRVRDRVPFHDVERVRWYQTYASRFVTRSLDLRGRNGSVKLTQVMPAASGPDDPRVAAYVRAIRSVLTALSKPRPDLRVEMSPPPFLRWFLFAAYLAFVAIGVFAMSAVLNSRNASDLWWLTAILGLAVLFCLVQTWRGRPWQEAETIAPDELARTLLS